MNKHSFSYQQMELDLGLGVAYARGSVIPVKNCWHFMTDGKAVDVMFYDDKDFMDGVNRIHVVLGGFDVIILAFVLMETHVHFILYGNLEQCRRFVHEYVRRTSMAISFRHGDRKKLAAVDVCWQPIDTQDYLKTAICYVIKNPTAAGINCMPMDYPWSSGSLYFRLNDSWTSPRWTLDHGTFDQLSDQPMLHRKILLKTNDRQVNDARVSEGLVFPGSFVNYSLAERIFRTPKSYLYHLGKTKEEEVDMRGASVSELAVPIQELRQVKQDLCKEMFGEKSSRTLDVRQRIRLAKVLKHRMSCSGKQVARICGLRYDQVADFLK